MCLFYVLIINGKFPWIVFIKKKKKCKPKWGVHLNQLILTYQTLKQFRLLLNRNISLFLHLHWGNLFILYMGINIYLIMFFSITNFMKICQICLNWIMFISLNKIDGIASLFKRSDAFQCCLFYFTMSSFLTL